jgi:hypothetical protein
MRLLVAEVERTQAALAAERIEIAHLRAAFVAMEKAANEREYERDALQRKLTTVLANYNEEAGRLMAERDGHRDDAAKLWADLAAARAMTRHWESRYALLESKWDAARAARAALKAKRGDAPRGGADTSVTVQMAGEDRHIPNLPALREAVAKMTEWPWLDNGTEATDEDCQETIIETSPRYTGVDFEIPVAGDMDRRKADIAGIVALRNAAPALLDELEACRDNDVRGMCIIEAAIRSPSIAHYMSHWEGRCLKAEAEVDAKRIETTRLREAFVTMEKAANERENPHD